MGLPLFINIHLGRWTILDEYMYIICIFKDTKYLAPLINSKINMLYIIS